MLLGWLDKDSRKCDSRFPETTKDILKTQHLSLKMSIMVATLVDKLWC